VDSPCAILSTVSGIQRVAIHRLIAPHLRLAKGRDILTNASRLGRPHRPRSGVAIMHRFALGWTLALGLATGTAFAQTPPNQPPITSPLLNQVVSPFDVHMEAGPFSDPDPGDTHYCSDWEIWTLSPLERVWVTSCIQGIEKVHTHLGDGTFENSHAGRTSLFFTTNYKLRVRFRDNTGLWSSWAEQPFSTGAATQVFPLMTDDVPGGATWKDEIGSSVILPGGGTQPRLRLESGTGSLLLQYSGNNGVTNIVTDPAALPGDVAVRVMIDGGSPGVTLPQSRVVFTDPIGNFHTIYLPAVTVPATSQIYYWVASDGSTYAGDASQTDPVFTSLVRASPVPWTVFSPGFEVDVVATGFQLPVNIAFVPNPGPNPTDPLFYVTELYGTIKVVAKNGSVSTYATNLLNFDPTGVFPGSGEQGLAGIVVDPATGDLFAGMLYDSAPPNGPHYPKVVRFHSNNGGKTAATQTTILSMPGEDQGQSHFISNFSIGYDGKLYVHMGDGFNYPTALDLNSFRGKILRMNFDGTAPSDNPLYNASDGINAKDYIYAYGFRNPFGGCWRATDGRHYEVENGNNVNDRFARVTGGASYGWDGTDASMTINAIYNWTPTVAPVNMAFIETPTFGGSRFPGSKLDHAFVTTSGPTYATGPSADKAIVEFVVNSQGGLISGPTPIIQYNGTGQATAVGLAAGPDGLYFTDLYKDQGATSPIDPGANVLRLRYRGIVNFSASVQNGVPPLTVSFTDLSSMPTPSAWFWEFGDGGTSTLQNPSHTYNSNGTFNARLTVTGSNGPVLAEKSGYITVGPYVSGLLGRYFQGIDLSNQVTSRVDSTLDFNWGTGSPSPQVPSDQFSVRWVGEVQPQFTKTYTFFTQTDDGVRLWINNQLLVDQWHNQALTEWSGNIALTAGTWYPVKMEYYEDGGDAGAYLLWQCQGLAKQVIPSAQLRVNNAVTTVDSTPQAPVARVMLLPSAPNPAHATTRFRFALPATARATLRLYDVRGSLVATIFDGIAEGQRTYDLPFNAQSLAGGVYFERLESASVRLTRKLVVLR
jgi:glucose/arabinose dehydrogenase/PKD repeat protein